MVDVFAGDMEVRRFSSNSDMIVCTIAIMVCVGLRTGTHLKEKHTNVSYFHVFTEV